MLLWPVLLLAGINGAAAYAPLENAMPARVTLPWTLEVGPGSVTVNGRDIRLDAPKKFEIAPPEIVAVADEKIDVFPAYNDNGPPWRKGVPLARLKAEECSVTGLLDADSLRVKSAAGDAKPYQRDTDYRLETFWANLGALPGGAIPADQPVFVDYRYRADRIDTIAVDAEGKPRWVKGTSGVGMVAPPTLHPGEIALINVWVSGTLQQLTDDQVLSIEFRAPAPPPQGETQAEQRLPKTLAKLRAGQPVTIVAWGDSVSAYGAGNQDETWYQNAFAAQLRKRFPQSAITLRTAAWPGYSSKAYMDAPAGGKYDFQRDVLDPKPDLITIEFVNDAYLDEAAVQAQYKTILEKFQSVGAEMVLLSPHLVRMDWLPSTVLKFDDDPRAYVQGLRRFAQENNVALADASKEWCRLWRDGIPYMTLLENAINHPNGQGHALFTKALIGLFPQQ